jgi:hypothetical protein
MSYRNPQTVIDTESAKYYAQAISNIGKLTAGVITNIDEKRRQEAKARKKRNLADTKNETEYSSDWLETTNKGISAAPINLQNDLRKLLDPKITEAAKIDTQLDNFSRGVGINLDGTAVDPNETSEQAFARKNGYIEEKNSLETLFTLGTKSALENLIQKQQSTSEYSKMIGKENGQSASATMPDLNRDVKSTMEGVPSIPTELRLVKVGGSYNFELDFDSRSTDRKKVKTILDKEGKAKDFDNFKDIRTYNLNKDFGPESMIINPNISKPFAEALDELQITKKGAPNIGSSMLNSMVDGVETITVGTMQYDIEKIDLGKFTSTVTDRLQSTIGGVVNMGSLEMGNVGVGLATMQSYVDDILPDTEFKDGKSYDDFVGTLKPDPSTTHGLTEESYGRLQEAIVDLKYKQLQGAMKRTNGRKIGTDTKLTPNQQLTQDQLQKSYDEGKGFVDNFVNNIFPHDKSVKNADMGKVVAELQNMGLVIKDQKPGGAFTLLDPDGGDGYLISPNSSIYENKLSLLNALGRKKLLIAKPKNTSDLPIFNN